jgi:hypothetical protein
MTNEVNSHRKVADRVLVGAFALALGLPTADRILDIDPSLCLSENRVMTPSPAWPSTKWERESFAQRFESYWNDSFGFRRLLIRSNAWVKYQMGVSATPLVVIGKNNWVYYTGDSLMETYQGSVQLSETLLKAWRDELQARQDWMERRGGHYLFVITPSKQSTYPEAVPSRYVRATTTTADQLVSYLATQSSVKIVDLRETVAHAKTKGDVFWRTDSHWNDRGMYFGYAEILRRTQQWYPNLVPLAESDFRPVQGSAWSGDLALMLGLVGTVVEKRVDWEPLLPWQAHEVNAEGYKPTGSSAFSAWEGPSKTLPRAVVFHDSYILVDGAEKRQ